MKDFSFPFHFLQQIRAFSNIWFSKPFLIIWTLEEFKHSTKGLLAHLIFESPDPCPYMPLLFYGGFLVCKNQWQGDCVVWFQGLQWLLIREKLQCFVALHLFLHLRWSDESCVNVCSRSTTVACNHCVKLFLNHQKNTVPVQFPSFQKNICSYSHKIYTIWSHFVVQEQIRLSWTPAPLWRFLLVHWLWGCL